MRKKTRDQVKLKYVNLFVLYIEIYRIRKILKK